MKLSLIIPVFNGEMYLQKTFDELNGFFAQKDYLHSIIFVNDGSTDNTKEFLENYKQTQFSLPITVVHLEKNNGKGFAIKTAVEMIKDSADIIGFTDVELPYGLSKIEEGFAYFQSQPDLCCVIGKRIQTHGLEKQYSKYRKFATTCFRWFLPKKIRDIEDTQCGFKIFRANMAKELFRLIKTNRWVFDIELLLAAKYNNFNIHEIPVIIKPSCVGRGRISFLRHGFKILKDLLKVRFYEFRNHYKKN